MKTASHVINIIIRRGLGFPYKRPWLKSVVTAVLREENIMELWEINCVITDDETIRGFNLRYRGIDKPTDVLSFALEEGPAGGVAVDFPSGPGAPGRFGDIMISYPRAAAQAEDLGHSVQDELTLLLVHGTLHLLGYGHNAEIEAKRMTKREKAVIKTIRAAGEKK